MMIATLLASEEGGNGFWLPHDLNEVFWGTLAFLIVFGLLAWKAGPAIKNGLAARPARIKDAIDSAESARVAAEGERDGVKSALADSDAEAARILTEARETAAKLVADGRTRAEADAVLVRERVEGEIAAAQRQAQSDLAAEVSRLALGAAEKVVATNLDDATQQSLIDSYISQVGTAR